MTTAAEEEALWNKRFQELVAHNERVGFTEGLTQSVNAKLFTLDQWVLAQRTSYQQGQLSSVRKKRLDSIDFVWNVGDTSNSSAAKIWQTKYEELIQFHAEFGHFSPDIHDKTYSKLGHWVFRQRSSKKNGIISQERIDLLDKIGFTWVEEQPPKKDAYIAREESWDQSFAKLQTFQKKFGHLNPDVNDKTYGKLGRWVRTQKWNYSNLPKDQILLLNSIGVTFVLNSHDINWEHQYLRLKLWKEANGHCQFLTNSKEDPTLGRWVSLQRVLNRKGDLIPERKEKLDAIGFVWSLRGGPGTRYKPAGEANTPEVPLLEEKLDRLNATGVAREAAYNKYDVKWHQMLEKLKEYKSKTGNCNVPRTDKENRKLARWVKTQRAVYKSGKLEEDRKHKLDNVGFDWEITRKIQYEDMWDASFAELVEFQRKNGHCNIPCRKELQTLHSWVKLQRRRCKETQVNLKPLSQRQIDLLNSIGFIWAQEEKWNDKYERLKGYQLEHGHCDVPKAYNQDQELGMWVQYQRSKYQNNELLQDRIERLEKIGFSWRTRERADERWQASYEELLAYYHENGHTLVPSNSGPLGTWVRRQRGSIRDARILLQRKKLLDDIGFVADVADATPKLLQHKWDEKFQQLVKFREKHGHTRVPDGPSLEDKTLPRWVCGQRNQFRRGDLPENRKILLDSIDFIWEPDHPRNLPPKEKDSADAVGDADDSDGEGPAVGRNQGPMGDLASAGDEDNAEEPASESSVVPAGADDQPSSNPRWRKRKSANSSSKGMECTAKKSRHETIEEENRTLPAAAKQNNKSSVAREPIADDQPSSATASKKRKPLSQRNSYEPSTDTCPTSTLAPTHKKPFSRNLQTQVAASQAATASKPQKNEPELVVSASIKDDSHQTATTDTVPPADEIPHPAPDLTLSAPPAAVDQRPRAKRGSRGTYRLWLPATNKS